MEWGAAYHLEAIDDEIEIPRPEVPDHLTFAWRCWHRLGLDRPWLGGGFGPAVPGRIPWPAMHAWAEHHEMTGAELEELDVYVRAMDDAYLAHHVAKAKR